MYNNNYEKWLQDLINTDFNKNKENFKKLVEYFIIPVTNANEAQRLIEKFSNENAKNYIKGRIRQKFLNNPGDYIQSIIDLEIMLPIINTGDEKKFIQDKNKIELYVQKKLPNLFFCGKNSNKAKLVIKKFFPKLINDALKAIEDQKRKPPENLFGSPKPSIS